METCSMISQARNSNTGCGISPWTPDLNKAGMKGMRTIGEDGRHSMSGGGVNGVTTDEYDQVYYLHMQT